MDLKLLNIINYIISTSNSTPTSILKAKYSYKGKAKFILIPTKIVVKKAAGIIKGVIIYKYNIV